MQKSAQIFVLIVYHAGVGVSCSCNGYWSSLATAAGVQYGVYCETLAQREIDRLQQTVHWPSECQGRSIQPLME